MDSHLIKSLDLLSLRSGGKDRKAYMSLPSSVDQSALSPDTFPAASSSGPERNRQLAKWASKHIYRIYQTAFIDKLESQMAQPLSQLPTTAHPKTNCMGVTNHHVSRPSHSPSRSQFAQSSVPDTDSVLHQRATSSVTANGDDEQ
ncbi:unnamed protein product [Echinostoma caproni]|uniref:Uncharacterized protein n=1 Tax=Echinostoma caproni TaxID=27848 RepID=A0A3P8L1D6_9TREM|nr:unnamed protein product [Echinostoma caproni]